MALTHRCSALRCCSGGIEVPKTVGWRELAICQRGAAEQYSKLLNTPSFDPSPHQSVVHNQAPKLYTFPRRTIDRLGGMIEGAVRGKSSHPAYL